MSTLEKIPKKRGRKPKPKTAEDLLPKVPKKRGRKPKVRTVSVQNPVIGITEETENIILHIPIREEILIHAGQDVNQAHLVYRPKVADPRPYDPNESGQMSVTLNASKTNKSNFFELPKDPSPKESPKVEQPIIATEKSPKKSSQVKKNPTNVSQGLNNLMGVNNCQKWPTNTSISCWWCCHSFDNMPLGLPQKRLSRKFLVTGCFCSFNCALAYNINLADFKVSERTSLLKYLFRAFYPLEDDNFSPAPSRVVLQKFGGNTTIGEYRFNFEVPSKEVRVLMPPIISMPPQIEEIQLKKQNIFKRTTTKKKFVALDMKEVERALNNIKNTVKPKGVNSLEITMGLRQG